MSVNRPNTRPVSLLIVDDHQVVISGIELMLYSKRSKYTIDSSSNGDSCIHALRQKHYDLVILDVNLPDTDTFQLVQLILSINAGQNILMFSMSSEALYAKRFLQLGALGFISKERPNDEVLSAIEATLEGRRYLSPTLMEKFTKDALFGNTNVFENLTTREFEIMSYFLKGHGSKEIANITNLHSSTIGTYKSKIFSKLGVNSIIELKELATINNIV